MPHYEIQGFDSSETESWFGSGGGKRIPPGKHIVEVIACDMKTTKKGDGNNLVAELQVVESVGDTPDAAGKDYTHYIYLGKTRPGPSDKDTWKHNLAAFCDACGVYASGGFDTEIFIGKQFMGIFNDEEVTTRNDDGTEKAAVFSRMTGMLDVEGNKPAKVTKPAGNGAKAAAKPAAARTGRVQHL